MILEHLKLLLSLWRNVIGKVLGKALKALEVPKNEYIVSTKCGRYKEGFDFSAERVIRSIDESLERLQLDYVDILQFEFGSLHQIVNETLPTLIKLEQAGKIRFTCITGLPLRIFTYVLDWVPPGTVDVILSYCHYSINDSINACRAAAEHCKERGKNISKLALQYSLANSTNNISSILVGMKSVNEVEENIAAAVELAKAGMDEETIAEITDILKPVKNQTWSGGI
ncbi:hypothetical protein K7X08_030285 [Anisodus acutangulus]|uniref:NADP-dependent oxidoreductase domain-containing protein n=1 Tax=Anisodus acutangulus TaxID=402998 RepID=A0A9Q1LMG7_9SOLA|nr:hypothetical protein K7X08_030285 [Anisodus acutangulus]